MVREVLTPLQPNTVSCCVTLCYTVLGEMLDGAQVEVTLAKPVDKDTYLRSPKMNRPFNVPAFYVPVDQYGAILPFYPSYFSPPRY